ncbi:MAG: DNA replication/repair protein RecF [Dokdonella sp.]
MRLTELRVECLRLFDRVELELGDGFSVFVGPNGSGKTSLLEAVYLLSHGRSFRATGRDALSQMGSAGFAVFGKVSSHLTGRECRLGLARRSGRLEARVDGEEVSLGTLVRACAVVCFEPGSHSLISGASEERRRFTDWGVFHVEHEFLSTWRRYQRALRQRNALLRDNAPSDHYEPWEHEMAQSGEQIAALRVTYLMRLRPHLVSILEVFLGELGEFELSVDRGWGDEGSLADALIAGRARDRERGYSSRGPHRADFSLGFEHAPRREHLSRGQEKLCALAVLLAQARLFAEDSGEWPILCLDDLASELDVAHYAQAIRLFRESGAQVLLTATGVPDAIRQDAGAIRMFHVEQGRIMA